MELNLLIHTFNSFGGGSTFGSVMALVDLHEESFGDGLKEIELQLYFKSKLPFAKQRANASLRELYEEFHNKNCNMLPIRRFMRKKGELKIQALAEFAAAEDVTGPSYPLNLEWQVAALDVLIREVEACRRKFKPTDDIRFNEFLDWLREQHGNLPKTQKEAEELDKRWRDAEDKKREQMDEWESLGLNWDDYHENARDVVSDPRLWSQGHDFSPNGNDSGADLIYMFRAEKARWARGGGNAFYQNLARDWGFDSDAKPDDSNSYEMKRESIIGLAFAFLKLFAYCPDWLANETIQTIEDYKTYLGSHYLDWPHRDLCLEYQEAMLKCLTSCPRK